MANRQKYPLLNLRGTNYEIAEARVPGEKKIITGKIDIDRTCFKKDKHEREILKLAKLQCKIDEMN